MPKFEDLTGQRFNRLTVIKRVEDYISPKGQRQVQWLCKCDCGNETVVNGASLKSGNVKSCGCLRKDVTIQIRFKDLTGQRFGMLTVIERAEDYVNVNGNHVLRYLCKCDCGNEKAVLASDLKCGRVKSCGCLKIENLTGQRFGKLVVVKRAEDYVSPKGVHSIQWLCKCDCGNEVVTLARNLKSGYTKSCGCLRGRRKVGDINA